MHAQSTTLERQQQVLEGFDVLARQQQAAAAAAAVRWRELAGAAHALEARQQKYEQLQGQLLVASEQVLEQSGSLAATQQLLLDSQQAGQALLGMLADTRWGAQDVAFWLVAVLALLLFLPQPDLKLGLLGLALLGMALEGHSQVGGCARGWGQPGARQPRSP